MNCKNVSSAGNQQERPNNTLCCWESSEAARQISDDFNHNLSIILGMLFTDGCVSPKGGSWRIYFSSKYRQPCVLFRSLLCQCFVLDNSKTKISRTRDGLWKAVLNSKNVGSFLTETFGTFRTLNFAHGGLTEACLPVDYFLKTNTIQPFLKAAFSCDGGISFYEVVFRGRRWYNRNLFLACHHPLLVNQYAFLLNYLGIKCSCYFGKLVIRNYCNFLKFRSEIGFFDEFLVTAHSKVWEGKSKSLMLDILIDSYNYSSPKHFFSKSTSV